MPQQGMISYPQRGKHIWFDGLVCAQQATCMPAHEAPRSLAPTLSW